MKTKKKLARREMEGVRENNNCSVFKLLLYVKRSVTIVYFIN